MPVTSQAASLGTGRFAIYDPPVVNLPGLIKVGETDLNSLTHHPSVQGYGSVVGKTYDDLTGTHLDGTLSPCALESGTFAAFGLTTLLALPASVAPPVAEGLSPAPGSSGCGIAWPANDATSRTWLFENRTDVDAVDLASSNSLVISPELRIGLVTSGGTVTWPQCVSRTASAHGMSISFSAPVVATGLVASGPGAGEIADTTIVRGPQTRIALRRTAAGRSRQTGLALRGSNRRLHPVRARRRTANRLDRGRRRRSLCGEALDDDRGWGDRLRGQRPARRRCQKRGVR